MPRPLIGVTLDAEKPGGYSKFPWYALRQNYLDAIDQAGGLAVALPHEPDRVAEYLERIDALVVTGGAFDVDPSYYGGGEKLIQHIPDSVADALADELSVNSAHHQAAADEPAGVVINATADDGVIEGIEAPAYRFCIGVQWHPEFLISEGDARLFKAFLGAAAAK